MPTASEGKVISQFKELPNGTKLFSTIFDDWKSDYNCILHKCTDEKIIVEHNGAKYAFDSFGNFDDGHGRQIFLKRRSNTKRRY